MSGYKTKDEYVFDCVNLKNALTAKRNENEQLHTLLNGDILGWMKILFALGFISFFFGFAIAYYCF